MSANVGRNGFYGLFEGRFLTGLAPQLLKSDTVVLKDEPRFVQRNPPETHMECGNDYVADGANGGG